MDMLRDPLSLSQHDDDSESDMSEDSAGTADNFTTSMVLQIFIYVLTHPHNYLSNFVVSKYFICTPGFDKTI